jgi:aminomethyltransferase
MTKAESPFYMMLNPRVHRSPFFSSAVKHGASVLSVYNHMFIPQGYEDPETEYWSIINGVAIWDVGVEQPVEITGPDAFAFTNMLTPRDLSKCKVWQCKYVVLTTPEGGIVNDPVLTRLGENHFWLAPADSDVLLWVKGVAVNSGMDVNIRLADVWPIQVQGPKSKQVMETLFGSKVMDIPYYYSVEAKLDGMPVVIARTGWTGEIGYEIYLRDGSRGEELWEKVMEAGKPHGIKATGPSHIRRIEAGILNYQIDMTLDTNPFEVGLDKLVDLEKKTDYLGKDVLMRVHKEGLKRKTVGLEVHTDPLTQNEKPWPVWSNGTVVGQVTSCIYSPRLKKNIAIAMVPIKLTELGTKLSVESSHGKVDATVIEKPFFDPKKDLPKS